MAVIEALRRGSESASASSEMGERRRQQPPNGARQPPRGSSPDASSTSLDWSTILLTPTIPEQEELSKPVKMSGSHRRRTVDGIDLPRHDQDESAVDEGHEVTGKHKRRMSHSQARRLSHSIPAGRA